MGLVSPESFAPIRTRLSSGGSRSGRTAHRSKRRPTRSRLRMGRTSFAQAQNAAGAGTPPDVMGRWSLAVSAATDATSRSVAHGEAWLDRNGVLTRGSVVAEDVLGGFALAYKVLSGFEESGKAMRGYVIDGLGAAQFSTPAIIDRLRGLADSPDVTGWPSGTTEPETFVLAACDPANPYGAALPWPQRDDADGKATGGPTRSAGALVVLIDGLPIAHLTRGGKTLTTFLESLPDGIDPAEVYPRLVSALTDMVAGGVLSPLVVEKCNGSPIHKTDAAAHLREAGAGITPKGVRISARAAAPRAPRAGRRASEAIEELSFDDPPPAPRNNGGFRPRGGYRR